MESLKKVIEFGERCAALPKKRHFNSALYTSVTQVCQILVEGAQTLLPMEQERFTSLETESCQDISEELGQCPEIHELKDQMVDTVRKVYKDISETNRTFNEVSQ